MRKLPGWVGIVALAVAVAGLYAQHGGESSQPVAKEHVTRTGRAGESPSEGEHGGMEMWKWANFALLAGALGYLVKKNAGPYFAVRSQKIRQDMLDAQDLRKEAANRAAQVDARLANLEAEIAALRAEAAQEAEAENQRMHRDTAAEIAKLQEHATQEIAAAGKAARMELRRYSAGLAVGLAERKIRERMNPETQDALVRGFVQELPGPSQASRAV